jgi:predicted esterase
MNPNVGILRVALTVGLLLSSFIPPPSAFAQGPVVGRYELGQRLRMFERAWEDQPDAAARRRAVPTLSRAVPQMLAGRWGDAAVTLDQVRFLLRGAEPPAPAVRWAESLLVRPSARLLDPAGDAIVVLLTACYDAKAEPPAGATLRVTLRSAKAEAAVARLPTAVTLPVDRLPEGDHTLQAEVVVGGQVLATYQQRLSVVPKLRERIEKSRQAAKTAADVKTTDAATLQSLTALLHDLEQGRAFETDYPAARLLAEAEALAKAVAAQERYYRPRRTGEFWLTLATEAGPAPVRLFVPEAVKAGQPVPLVVALHGAGGSENLYFDGYGAGAAVRLANERGWMVVGTRVSGLFGGPPPVPAVVDELARLYAVDKQRVYLLGHSLGAGHAVTLAQTAPGRFAAIAPLGGGGGVSRPEAVKGLPVFVGCGTEDFLLTAAQGLARSLEQAGAKVTYKEYPDIEHIVVVREALKDVYDFFAANGKKKD